MVRCNALYKKNGNWQHTYSSDQNTEHPRKIFVPQEWVVCNVYLQNTSSKIFSSNTLTVSTRSQHHPTNCSVLPRRYFVWDYIYPQRFGTSSLSHDHILITNHERRKSSSTDQKSSDQIHQGRFHERSNGSYLLMYVLRKGACTSSRCLDASWNNFCETHVL